MALLLRGKEAEAQRDFDRCLRLNPGLKPSLERQIKAIKEQRSKPNRSSGNHHSGASRDTSALIAAS